MSSIVTRVCEAAGAFVSRLTARRPTLGPLLYTTAGMIEIATATGIVMSPIVKYSTDVILGLCSARAFMVHDEAAIRKLMVFLSWEVYRAIRWYNQLQVPDLTILSKDLNPTVATLCVVVPFAVVMTVIAVSMYRDKRKRTADLESQQAAVTEDINDTEQQRTAMQAMNPASFNLDEGAGPSREMNSNPLHQNPDNAPIARPQPMPMATPAPRTMLLGFTLDWSRIESA